MDSLKKDYFLHYIRKEFTQKNYFEVHSPSISYFSGVESFLENIIIENTYVNKKLYLATSPELYLKKIYSYYIKKINCCGIFSIANSFRNERISPTHSYEFLLLEWYTQQNSYLYFIEELFFLIKNYPILKKITNQNYLVFTVQEIFQEIIGFHWKHDISADEIEEFALNNGITKQTLNFNHQENKTLQKTYSEWKKIVYFNLLFDHIMMPFLKKHPLVFLHEFPYFIRGLATINKNGFANRIEAYIYGLEIANGCNEIYDEKEMINLLRSNNKLRELMQWPIHEMDSIFLKQTSSLKGVVGMALGVERLLGIEYSC